MVKSWRRFGNNGQSIPADTQLKQQEKDHINKMRGDWKENFKQKGWDDLNQADIVKATGAQGLQFLKALAEASGTSYYKNREGPRSSGRAGGGTQLNVGELQQKLIDNLMIPEKGDIDAWDETLVQTLQELEDGRANLASAKKKRQQRNREEKDIIRVRTYSMPKRRKSDTINNENVTASTNRGE